MTVSVTAPRNDYIGTGAVATYDYDFRIFAATDLRLTVRTTAGVETALVYLTDYTVTGVNGANGGTITLLAGNLTTDYVLTIRFDRSPQQTTDLRNQGSFFAETHENKFDELTRYIQALNDVTDRSIRIPETEDPADFSMTLPTTVDRASKFLAFDTDGNPIAANEVTGVPATTFGASLIDDSTAAQARATLVIISATTAAEGLSELATTTEVLTGTDTVRAVTPDALAALWEQGADITSAATISVGEGGYFVVTGSTGPITDIDFATTKAGRIAWLKFSSTPTLTHHATTMILPTGANIVAAAGDVLGVVSEGGDNVRVFAYLRATGQPIAAATGTLTAGASLTQNPYDDDATATQAHGLGGYPTLVIAYLECLSTEYGYAVGDRISMSASYVLDGSAGSTSGGNLTADTTNIVWTAGAQNPVVVRKDTRAQATITAAKWKYVAVPYKLN